MESPFQSARIAPRPGALQDEAAAPDSDTAPSQSLNARREVSKSTLNSLLHLIVTILRNSGGELKATDGTNCLKSILQRDMPSAIKDISDAGGLTRFCEIHSSYLEFISDGCGSGNIRLKNKGKVGLPSQLFGAAPGSGLSQIYSGDNATLRIGDLAAGGSHVFANDSVTTKTTALPGGLYGDWSPNILPDKIPTSPAAPVVPRLQIGDDTAPKTWTLWGHGAPLHGLATRQDKVGSESAIVSRGVHGPFSIVVKDDTSESNGPVNGIVEGCTSRVGGASSVIISSDETDCEVPLDGIKTFGSAGEASSSGQLSLLSAGNHFGTAPLQPKGQSPRQPRRLEAFAQMSERQAYEAFSTSQPGLSHSASAFNPGSGSLGMLDEANDLDLAKSRFRAGDGLRAFSSVRGENDVVLPMRASPGNVSGMSNFEDRGLGMSEITLPFAANAAGSEPHKSSFLLSDFERPAGIYGAANSMKSFVKDLDDAAGGSDPVREGTQGSGTLDYLGGDKSVIGGGFMSDEMSGYFSSMSLGAQRKALRPPGTDMFLMDPHALPDGLAPWSGVDGNFPAATYLDKSGTPQNIAEFREGIGRVLLEKLVEILRQESGELLASLAPDKLYTSVARGKEEITAVGGLRKFCLLYPADLEFIADTGGRCRIRLRRSSTFDVPSWPLQDGPADAPKPAAREGRRREEGGADGNGTPGVASGEGGSEEPRKPEVRRTAAVERLVGILRAEGGDMSATQATSKLYKALPRAKEDVVAAGGLRKFCELFPTDLEFVADLQGRCRIRARRATKGSRGSGRAERAAKEAQGDSKASSRSSSTARPASQSGQSAVQSNSSGNFNSSVVGDSAMAAAAASNALAVGAPGLPGDAPLIMPISREATTTLQRLVGILRGEGGEMYAARAPEV